MDEEDEQPVAEGGQEEGEEVEATPPPPPTQAEEAEEEEAAADKEKEKPKKKKRAATGGDAPPSKKTKSSKTPSDKTDKPIPKKVKKSGTSDKKDKPSGAGRKVVTVPLTRAPAPVAAPAAPAALPKRMRPAKEQRRCVNKSNARIIMARAGCLRHDSKVPGVLQDVVEMLLEQYVHDTLVFMAHGRAGSGLDDKGGNHTFSMKYLRRALEHRGAMVYGEWKHEPRLREAARATSPEADAEEAD